MATVWEKLRLKISPSEPEEEVAESGGFLAALDEASTLSWKQRAIGFGICFGVGLLLSALSIPLLWSLSFTRFAIFWALGSILSMGSTMFLMGPKKQCTSMFQAHRALATCVYVGTTVATLALAFKYQNAGICLIMLIVQLAALVWYCSTWIPGGQSMLKGVVFK